MLFLHGLEGSPNGSKVRALRAEGFAVEAPDMKMGMWAWGREHSVLRQLLRLGEVRLSLGLGLLGLVALVVSVAGGCLTLLIIGRLILRRHVLAAEALSRSFDDCVRVAAAAAAESEADVLVGSSWGGAVALELVASGRWTGPAILLAPALERVHRRGRREDADMRMDALTQAAARQSLRTFHDPTDDVVPFADSEALRARCGIPVVRVDAGGHRLLGLLDSGALAAAVRDLASRPTPG